MTPAPEGFSYRDGTAADASAVAALHAASWRGTYRGSATDEYLDGPVGEERHAFWTQRLAARPDLILVLAEARSQLAGFVCTVPDHDARWGALIDNLHVADGFKRAGLGRALMGEAAARLAGSHDETPVHLFVLEANHAARSFYEQLGGEVVAREAHALPDGTGVQHPVFRVAWPSPRALRDACLEVAR